LSKLIPFTFFLDLDFFLQCKMIFVLYCSYLGSLPVPPLRCSAREAGAAATERAWNICPVPLQDEALSFWLLFLSFLKEN
jgi:hypothetical protein